MIGTGSKIAEKVARESDFAHWQLIYGNKPFTGGSTRVESWKSDHIVVHDTRTRFGSAENFANTTK